MATVREIMRKDISCVSPSASIVEVAKIMQETEIGMIPICENGKFRGVVTMEGIIARIAANGHSLKCHSAATVMRNDAPKVSPGSELFQAAKIMATRRAENVPVVQNGNLLGVLTLNDLLHESPALAVLVMTKKRKLKKEIPSRWTEAGFLYSRS